MRVPLKGINSKKKTLADGRVVTYWYAWKGGPRLRGEPGTPEFIASYHEAVQRRSTRPKDTLQAILRAYQESADFTILAPRTRADYAKQIHKIEKEFGDFPLDALSDRRTRGEFLAWRDRLAAASKRQADYCFSVFGRALSWAFNRGHIPSNPIERPGRLYRASRAEQIWTDADEAVFMRVALRLALMLALWTGQRQGDLLRLTWAAYDGETIRLIQSKTGARVTIPVGEPLKLVLDATKRQSPTILVNLDGHPWTPDGFRASWGKACKKAGIEDVTFHDLRGTAVTRLALAGATEAEIATLTGHSLRDVRTILDSHYLKRDSALAESAIRKLEKRTKIPDQTPDQARTVDGSKEKTK
jgi:integrase